MSADPFPREARANYVGSKVKIARERLQARANEILSLQLRIIKLALKAGEFEVAAKANQFLLEHVPSMDGVTVLDPGVDKGPKTEGGYQGPSIQIGFSLGGLTPAAALPAAPDELPPSQLNFIEGEALNEKAEPEDD